MEASAGTGDRHALPDRHTGVGRPSARGTGSREESEAPAELVGRVLAVCEQHYAAVRGTSSEQWDQESSRELVDIALRTVHLAEPETYPQTLDAYLHEHRARLERLWRSYGPGGMFAGELVLIGLPGFLALCERVETTPLWLEGIRTAEETTVDGETEPMVVKLGVWTSNARARWDKRTSEQQAALAALDVPWAEAAAVPVPSGGMGDGSIRPAPSDAQTQEDHDQGATVTGEERETQAARGRARAQRVEELMRNHTKAELLCMAYAGGLVNHNSPEKWRKDESASAVVHIELRAADRALTAA